MTSVDLVIPVYNEEDQLEETVDVLHRFRKERFASYRVTIVIANNGSTDATEKIGKSLARRLPAVTLVTIPKKGRGHALATVWGRSTATVLAYLDVDLSADLSFLPSLLDAVAQHQADIAIGSRLATGARVTGRTLLREVLSRGYNLLIRWLFQIKLHDAQCGFKAISQRAWRQIGPLVRNRNWFFDSELLIIALKSGFRVEEVPISWTDDPTSTVKVFLTAREDLLGLVRLLVTRPWKTLVKRQPAI